MLMCGMLVGSANAWRWCAQFTFTDDEFSDPLGLTKAGADLSVMVSGQPLLGCSGLLAWLAAAA